MECRSSAATAISTTPQAQLAVAVLGRAGARLLTSFDARPGDALVAAIDHRGAYREPFDNWQAALGAPHARLRGDLALLPEIAEPGLAHAAKDISQGGLVGTATMLAECSGVGIDIDLDAIESASRRRARPLAEDFSELRLSACDGATTMPRRSLRAFAARDIHAAPIGEVRSRLRSRARLGLAGAPSSATGGATGCLVSPRVAESVA